MLASSPKRVRCPEPRQDVLGVLIQLLQVWKRHGRSAPGGPSFVRREQQLESPISVVEPAEFDDVATGLRLGPEAPERREMV
jgi:hypothetical protein